MDKRHQRMLEEVLKIPGNGASTLGLIRSSCFVVSPRPCYSCLCCTLPFRPSNTIRTAMNLPTELCHFGRHRGAEICLRSLRGLPRPRSPMGERQHRHLPLRWVRECAPQDGHAQVESVSETLLGQGCS
jgi:hypothetical protein